MKKKYACVEEIRGEGLLIGMVLDRPAKPLETLLAENGLLTIATAGDVIRMLPPLTVSPGQLRRAARIIDKACATWMAEKPSP